MKALIIAAAATAALSAGVVSAQAQDDTDRAMGAGSYIHPNGPSNGAWGATGSTIRYSGATVTDTKHKAR